MQKKNNDQNNKFKCSHLSVHIDNKIYIFIIAVSLVLLFFSIWEIKPVVVEISDFIGLFSHLTVSYWVGFILITSCIILLYIDGNENKIIHLLVLMVIGL